MEAARRSDGTDKDSCPGCGNLSFRTMYAFRSTTYGGHFNRCHKCDGYSIWRGSELTGVGENFPLTSAEADFLAKVNEAIQTTEGWVARAHTHREVVRRRWGSRWYAAHDVPIERWVTDVLGKRLD